MSIRKIRPSKDILRALALAFSIVGVCTAQTTPPDLTIPTLGEYSATAPYNCPKSAQILANTRDQMVGELLANSNYLNSGSGHAGAINALAHRDAILEAFIANAPADPDVTDWIDPLQFSQSTLSELIFQHLADSTVDGVVFDITDDGDYIHVIADIPTGSGNIFARLKAEVAMP